MVRIPQIHNQGAFTQMITNRDLFVVTSETKPIKYVTEGEVLLETGTAMDNADMTIDLFAGEKYGAALIMDQVWGQYRLP